MSIPAPQPGSAALITGASSGIGRELARQLAERGHDLVLVARRRERLEELAEELRQGGRTIEVIETDVADTDSRTALVARVGELDVEVDVLILCAGFGMGGAFTSQDPERIQLMLRTNLEGVVMLAREYAPGMERRGRGAILVVSSFAGNQPMPNFGAYAATKAGATSFAEMLHEELRPNGVTVTALCPGGVYTEFAGVAGMSAQADRTPSLLMTDPERCAREAISGMERGKRKVVPTVTVKVLSAMSRHLPRGLTLRAARKGMA